jgi:hypothetical protein
VVGRALVPSECLVVQLCHPNVWSGGKSYFVAWNAFGHEFWLELLLDASGQSRLVSGTGSSKLYQRPEGQFNSVLFGGKSVQDN